MKKNKTKTIEEYMNDPDIINEPMYLREIHAIRFKIQDELEGMSFQERADYMNAKCALTCKKYNIKTFMFDAKSNNNTKISV
ncbi:MAG: hypothetical protein LBT79_06160 [Elusimicrobiota bacterium]|jgi:hypothetical protein|nr:hypothetical protein [Elusimicrobiota bacterium]